MKINVISKIKKKSCQFLILPLKDQAGKFISYTAKNLPTNLDKKTQQELLNFLKETINKDTTEGILPWKIAENLYLVLADLSADKDFSKNKSSEAVLAGLINKFVRSKKQTSYTISSAEKTTNLLSLAYYSTLANYRFKISNDKKDDKSKIIECNIFSQEKEFKKKLNELLTIAESVNLTRRLVDTPTNYLGTKDFVAEAKQVCKGILNPLKLKVLGEKEMKKLKMGSLLAVGQGSAMESQLVVIEYRGGKRNEKPLALVGKGVVFDSGGYNIKPTNYIEDMKVDMGGAGSVLGVMKYLAKNKPKINVVGVMGLVENMVSSNAYRPGDVITAMNGQTIEVLNTDAEGRLVLADCLTYVQKKFKPQEIIDLATLTGAVVVALGYEYTGIMGNSPEMIKNLKKSAEKSEEKVWHLPLEKFHKEMLKGEISDLVNVEKKRSAGSTVAGAFLWNFIENDTAWTHLDIAGTAHKHVPDNFREAGATGEIVRTLINYINDKK